MHNMMQQLYQRQCQSRYSNSANCATTTVLWMWRCVQLYLDTRKDDKQLEGKVGQLKHDTAAFSPPLLLPAVQPIRNETPAEAY